MSSSGISSRAMTTAPTATVLVSTAAAPLPLSSPPQAARERIMVIAMKNANNFFFIVITPFSKSCVA